MPFCQDSGFEDARIQTGCPGRTCFEPSSVSTSGLPTIHSERHRSTSTSKAVTRQFGRVVQNF